MMAAFAAYIKTITALAVFSVLVGLLLPEGKYRRYTELVLGAPVALANATCLPELYGDTARYFDPYDYDVDLDALAAQPVAAPDEVLKKYSWDKTAEFWLHEMEKYAKQ